MRYAIASLESDVAADKLLGFIRGHWGIENRVRYVRDFTMGEDASQVRAGAAPQVMATLGILYTGWCYIQACCKQIKATDPRRASSLLLYPLVPRCSLFSLSLSAECLPSFRLASSPLPITCRLAGSKSYTT